MSNSPGASPLPIVAAIQMVSGPSLTVNLASADRLIREAAEVGARLLVLPENFAFMGEHEADIREFGESDGDGPIQNFLRTRSAELGVYLVGGSVPISERRGGKVYSACLFYGPDGERLGRYDKIHLFDVALPGSAEHYAESDHIEAGSGVVVVETEIGRFGLAICYDLRFPELFRAMSARAVDCFIVPAAFTANTGEAHWEVLCRSRAVENLSYLVAAGQGGDHPGGRATFGHSMVVDPWGAVLDCVERGEGVALGRMNRARTDELRRRFPVLEHRRSGLFDIVGA